MYAVRGTTGVVLLLAASVAGCATKSDVRTLQVTMLDEIRAIRAEQVSLRADLGMAVDSLQAAEGRRQVRQQSEFERRLGGLEDRLAELLELVGQNRQVLLDLLDGGGVASTPARPPAGASPVTGQPGSGGVPEQFYQAALTQLNQGNYETARGAFQDFLIQYRNHELAVDAQYNVAMAYAAEGDSAQALNEFQRVTEQWPNSPRSASALYQRGLIQTRSGNTAEARRLFQQVISGYPNAPEFEPAQQRLRELGG